MKVLLLGAGGREHALGWKLSASSSVDEVIAAPGNPGLAEIDSVVPGIDATDAAAVADLAEANGIDLVVVGPEAPLAAGVVDELDRRHIPAFGPDRAGAQLESSKTFAKAVMHRAGVATAAGATFTDATAASAYLAGVDGPYVVKADGLAAGKGVLVTDDLIAAQAWANICIGGRFGAAGRTVVIEEHLAGEEVSVFALTDGHRALVLEPARDYKRLHDGDGGPNTGGMGCYSPVTDLPADLAEDTLRDIIEPVLATLADDGITYRGFLYAGLMLTDEGVKVLEFNCRMGDPETQVVLPRLDEDLFDLLYAGATGALPRGPLAWSATAAVDVVLAAPGYPDDPERGAPIEGLDTVAQRDDVLLFQAGTAREPDGLVTAGGRVVNVVGLGGTVPQARVAAYEAVSEIRFPGMQFRSDIAR